MQKRKESKGTKKGQHNCSGHVDVKWFKTQFIIQIKAESSLGEISLKNMEVHHSGEGEIRQNEMF